MEEASLMILAIGAILCLFLLVGCILDICGCM